MKSKQNQASLKRNGTARLRKQVATLRRQLRELTRERDCYLRAIHALAKQRITPEQLQQWMREEQPAGSLSEVLEDVRKEK